MTRRKIIQNAACLWLATGPLAQAVTTTWTNATGNRLWADPANWSSGVPTASDTAALLAGGTIILPSTGAATAKSVQSALGAPSGTQFRLQGGRLVSSEIGGFPGEFHISSEIGALGDVLVLRDTFASGAIGDGAGGGNFDLLAMHSFLRAGNSFRGQAVLFGTMLEQNGSVAQASGVLLPFGQATLNASAAAPAIDRLPDDGPVRMIGGVLAANAGSVTITQETIGTLSIERSRADLILQGPASGSLVLTAKALFRSDGAVLRLRSNETSAMRFVAKPTGADGVLPTDRAVLGYGIGTIGTGASSRATFLTYDLGVDPNDVSDDPGLRPLAWDSEHATSIAAGGNVRLGAGDAVLPLAADASIRSLSLTDGSLQLDGSQLVINSGLIMQGAAAGTGIGGNGSLSFPGEAPILTLGKVTRTIDVPIQAASLVKGGDGTLALTRANTFPLGVHIAEGTLAIRAPAALGSATVSSSGATLRIEAVSQTIQHLRGLGSFRISNSLGNFAFGATAGTLNVEAGRTLTIHNIEGGGGYFVVAGDGTVHIPADEQSQADLVVTGGELRLDGEVAMGGNVSVLDGRLSGTGTIAGTITGDGPAGSVISPGPGPARLTAWQLSLSHLLELELNGVQAGTLYDQLRVIERVSIAGGLDLDLSVGYAAQLGDSFTIIDNLSSQPPLNPFTGPAEGALFTANGYQLRLSYLGGDGNDVTLTVVPEPGLAGMGLLLGVLALRRRGHWRCPMSRRSAPRR